MTEAGRRPVDEFLDGVSEDDAARIAAAMKQVRRNGRADPDVNHLRGDIWQLEVDGERVIYRLLYAELGRSGQALLALEIVTKKWQKAKSRHIELAEGRLADWLEQGRRRRAQAGSRRTSG